MRDDGDFGATAAAKDFAFVQAFGVPEGPPPERGAAVVTDDMTVEVTDDAAVVMTADVCDMGENDVVPACGPGIPSDEAKLTRRSPGPLANEMRVSENSSANTPPPRGAPTGSIPKMDLSALRYGELKKAKRAEGCRRPSQ